MTDGPVESLVRWAVTTTHRKPRDRRYAMDDNGDFAAWLDRLSGRIAEDRAEVAQKVRKPTDWRPRPYTDESEFV